MKTGGTEKRSQLNKQKDDEIVHDEEEHEEFNPPILDPLKIEYYSAATKKPIYSFIEE